MLVIDIQGPSGTVRCDWTAAALLRDNVMHWLEDGAPSGEFPAIHALAEADPSEPGPHVFAADLADELAVALPLLTDVRGRDVAVGIWTRARMTGQPVPPGVRGTMLARLVGWSPPVVVGDDVLLGALFRPFLAALRRAAGRIWETA